MKHEDLTFAEIKMPNDLKEINGWTKTYAGTQQMQDIKNFVLDCSSNLSLGQLIDNHYEKFAIGNHEFKKILTIKNDSREIVAFAVIQAFYSLDPMTPEFLIQFLVVNPKYQHKGYGTKTLDGLFKYIEKTYKPDTCKYLVGVHKENTASLKLFKKRGFEFQEVRGDYLLHGQASSEMVKQTQQENKTFE